MSSGLKILFLCEGDAETHDSWSGISRSLVVHLRRAGHSVVPGDADLYGMDRILAGIRAFSPRLDRWRMRHRLSAAAFSARSRKAARHVARHAGEVDLILQVGATFRIEAPRDIPLVLYCDSNIELSRSAAYSGVSEAAALSGREIDEIRAREASVYDDAALIFTMSDQLRDSFVRDFGIPPDRLCTVHCGPNIELDTPVSLERRRPEDPPTVLFVGRDFKRKGGDVLLEAFQAVRQSLPDARMVMVGPDPRNHRAPGVEFLGYLDRDDPDGRERMDRAYREADVFCLPTRFEPFGTAFVEAMLHGLPCIGPRAWAVPEIIRPDTTGVLVPPEDPYALARALILLLEDPDRAERLGRAARDRVMEHFTWPRIVETMTTRMSDIVESEPVQGSERSR
ncbi:MAG: glycosyltransferase family 1 protein [Gemmatimonadales bacterium]|nr:MAG: glycosyltransferase family 1 protein [Gemmatimonadales bacterium]